jgi:hypothetical protein
MFSFFEDIIVTNYHNETLLILWAFTSIFIYNFFVSDIQALMVCRKEIRIESIQQIVENKNLKIFMTMNVSGHKTLIEVKFPAF